MVDRGYKAVDSDDTMFMKWVHEDFITHGLFIDDLQHASTNERLMEDLFSIY
jgi:hypothetical protein